MSEDPNTSAGAPIKVFLLDDHEVVRRGLRDLLDAEPDITVVGEAGTAEQALARGRRSVRTSPYSTCGYPTVTASPSAASCAHACRAWPV